MLWITLATLILSCPIKRIRPHIFKPCIEEAEEVKKAAAIAFSIVKRATDEEALRTLGRTWYQAILWKAYLP
jgi:hypothetical protein